MTQDVSKQTLFVLITGFSLTVFNLIYFWFIPLLQIQNPIFIYGILYLLEFGLFCVALSIYKSTISSIVWFTKALSLIILATLFKIIITAFLLYLILSAYNLFVEPGIKNLFALFGPMVRGFIFEFAFIAIAAKLFETDIFQKPKQNGDDDLLDKI